MNGLFGKLEVDPDPNVRLTPPRIIRDLGPFDLDPAAHPNSATAKRLIFPPTTG